MNAKKFILGTLAGAVSFFFLGFLFYVILFESFFQANAGTATGVQREMPILWALIAGELAYGALYTLIFLRWANISTFLTGAKAGALLGLLIALGYRFINYSTTNIFNINVLFGDAMISCISGAITGGIIAWVLGRIED